MHVRKTGLYAWSFVTFRLGARLACSLHRCRKEKEPWPSVSLFPSSALQPLATPPCIFTPGQSSELWEMTVLLVLPIRRATTMCYIAFVSALQLQPKGQPIQTMWEALEELMRHCNTTSKYVPKRRRWRTGLEWFWWKGRGGGLTFNKSGGALAAVVQVIGLTKRKRNAKMPRYDPDSHHITLGIWIRV